MMMLIMTIMTMMMLKNNDGGDYDDTYNSHMDDDFVMHQFSFQTVIMHGQNDKYDG